jgi:hypothetical protein
MIELLRIHALVRMAEGLSVACRRQAKRVLDEAEAWADARDAARLSRPEA